MFFCAVNTLSYEIGDRVTMDCVMEFILYLGIELFGVVGFGLIINAGGKNLAHFFVEIPFRRALLKHGRYW